MICTASTDCSEFRSNLNKLLIIISKDLRILKKFEIHGVQPELLDTFLVVLSILMYTPIQYTFQINMSNSILFRLLIGFGLTICTFRLRAKKKFRIFRREWKDLHKIVYHIYMNVREMETAKRGVKYMMPNQSVKLIKLRKFIIAVHHLAI